MSEWLTTGQVIDRLGKGRVAVNDTKDKVYWENDELVIESITGAKYNCLRYGLREIEWRILPNYVSFEVAMQAHKKKKAVTFHHQDIIYTFEHSLCPEQFEKIYRNSIALHELINGKWTIEDE